ncbi:MAG: ROK family protein [bacterium]|nr:ROK family protein [bacterium]
MIVGIDIGGTNIKGILTNDSGKILSFKKISTPGSAQELDQAIYNLIEVLATSISISKIDIRAIGIGAAGSIDKKKGIIIKSSNIEFWDKYPLAKNVEKLTGIKVFLENDATVALIGGWWKGNGSKFRNWIMLTLGTGIGAGVIIDNKIYTGHTGNAMEAGHMAIDLKGKQCNCGNYGCFEQYASATALVNFAKSYFRKYKDSSVKARVKEEELTAKLVFEEAEKGDELALQALTDVGTYLGIGITNLINLFNPEAIILGGGLSQAHKYLIPIVKKVVDERAHAGLKEGVKFLPIKDQSKIPPLGAARMAIDSLNAQ